MARTITTAAALVGLLAGGSDAFIATGASSSSSSRSARVARAARLHAAVKSPPTSRFEKLKLKWKGPAKVEVVVNEEEERAYAEFSSFLEEHTFSTNRGQTVRGRVVQYDNSGVLVDIGGKANAFMPLREAGLAPPPTIEEAVQLEEELDFVVVNEENDMGQVTLSIRRLEFDRAWERVLAMKADDAAFEGEVIAVNRGGAIALVEGLRAFLPGSHMTGNYVDEEIVGKVLPFKFLEVAPEQNKLVISNRRAVLEKEMKELSRGDVVEGVVKALKPYGAFVEIRGMSGLLHISQITIDRIDDLTTVLQPGMPIKCMIIDHDKVNGRIALSTKTLEPEPGDMLRNPQKVFDLAEETAAAYHKREDQIQREREDAAKSLVQGLGEGLGSFEKDVLAGIADGIESVLSSGPASDSNDLLK
jgi:small subunit ribosomal protein S1